MQIGMAMGPIAYRLSDVLGVKSRRERDQTRS
jgi:hypothetical protein